MKFCEPAYTLENPLLQAVVNEFERAADMISSIEDLAYRAPANGTGSIGGHFRHNLDFANSYLNGIAEQRIDYNDRQRDTKVESDRGYAIGKVEFTILRLSNLSDETLQRLVYVRSEVELSTWLPSSLFRELEFLHSHTVHHHALIREKLASFGVGVEAAFGVAPSTLEYWRREKAL